MQVQNQTLAGPFHRQIALGFIIRIETVVLVPVDLQDVTPGVSLQHGTLVPLQLLLIRLVTEMYLARHVVGRIGEEPHTPHTFDGRQPFLGILPQHPRDKFLQSRGISTKHLREDEISCQNVLDSLAVILGLKGSAASDHFVDGDSCSPDIDLLIVPSPAEHLRSPIV